MSIFLNAYAIEWQPLAGHVRYDEACFLTAHNAYASVEYGYKYAQQRLSIPQQLKMGVRGFMLDTRIVNNEVRLCHKNAFITRLISRGEEPQSLHDILVIMRTFLEKNPSEVISLFLETYLPQPGTIVDKPFRLSGLESYILRPDSRIDWPTLEWMRKENKRLVIFNAQSRTDYCFNAWQNVVENQWGTLHPAKACRERPESQQWQKYDRSLYLLNYFPMFNLSIDGSYRQINTKGLDAFLKKVLSKGLSSGSNKQLLPTFLCMDYIDIGNGLKHVIRINSLKQQHLLLAQAPIEINSSNRP